MWHNLPYRWRRKLTQWIIHFMSFYEKLSFRIRFLQDDLYEFNRKAAPWLHVFSILLSIAVFVSLLTPLIFNEQHEYLHVTRLVDQTVGA
jgi:trk system potassium uptake protein